MNTRRAEPIAWRSILLLLLALAPAACAAGNAAPARYTTAPRSQDGIGKVYMWREIAQIMGVGGAPWLERQERAHEERPDLVLAALDIKPGMVTLHPSGFTHGPHPKAFAAGAKAAKTMTDAVAVMIDARRAGCRMRQ